MAKHLGWHWVNRTGNPKESQRVMPMANRLGWHWDFPMATTMGSHSGSLMGSHSGSPRVLTMGFH